LRLWQCKNLVTKARDLEKTLWQRRRSSCVGWFFTFHMILSWGQWPKRSSILEANHNILLLQQSLCLSWRASNSKRGFIKHDVTKLCGNYHLLPVALNKNDTSSEDTLQKALNLFKLKHPKNNYFGFIHLFVDLQGHAKMVID
jgi:hypothetical protein